MIRTMRLLSFLLVTSACECPVEAQTATYTNPVYARDFPDPFVLRHDGLYYAYATQTRVTGFQVMESDDLIRWTWRPLDFSIPWSSEHLWAPEVVERGGSFYLTYSALDPLSHRHHIAIATADHPAGPFTHRAILVRGDDNEVGVIDATIAFEPDGGATLVYSEERPRRIVARRMTPDLMGVKAKVSELIRPDLDWEAGVVEAPTLVRRDGRYHLFYSGGPYQGTKAASRYAVGHASSRALLGPYAKSPRPLLESVEGQIYGPGHQCVIATPGGSTWMLYHAWDAEGEPNYRQNPTGRTLRLDPLVWDNGRPRIPGPSTTPVVAPIVR